MSDFTNGYVYGGATDIYHKAVDDALIIAGSGNLWGSHHTTEIYDSGTTSTTDTWSTTNTSTSDTSSVYAARNNWLTWMENNPRNNKTSNTTISMTDYDYNSASNVTVVGTAGNDKFSNYRYDVAIYAGDGDDSIHTSHADSVAIYAGAGNDSIFHYSGDVATIYAGSGNDTINIGGFSDSDKIYAGAGDDFISNSKGNDNVTINGGVGDDTVENFGENVTINTGKGNDSIDLYNDDNVIQYTDGDGDDTISGGKYLSALYVEGDYSCSTVGSDVVVYVGSGSITFTDYSGEIDIETVPSGTFSSVQEPVEPVFTTTSDSSTTATTTTDSSVSSMQNIYTGGDKTISNYAGQAVTLGTACSDFAFIGNSFVLNSSLGGLTIENVVDKVVDLRNGAGDEFIKAYKASSAGTIDGRGIAGYEIIEGSSAGTDVIFAGDGGSQLWGGSDSVVDALIGGNGSDIFIGGRYQGADVFYNASSADFVNLTDATLSDIVAAVEVNGNIAIGFNTGNIITIQSTELLSAAIQLGDGSAWRFNHVTKAWQGA